MVRPPFRVALAAVLLVIAVFMVARAVRQIVDEMRVRQGGVSALDVGSGGQLR